MEYLGEIVFFGTWAIVTAIFVCVYLWRHRREVARKKALAAFANRVGLTCDRMESGRLPFAYRSSDLPDARDLPRVEHLLSGFLGPGEVRVFDLEFSITFLGRDYQNCLTVCAFHVDRMFPTLYARPAGIADRLSSVVGMKDIEFDSQPFDSRYVVASTNEDFARTILDERLRAFFVERPGITLEMYCDHFLLYYTTRYVSRFYARKMEAADVVKLVEDALALAEHLCAVWARRTA